MSSFDAVLRLLGGVKSAELRYYIDEGWVRPDTARGELVFREIDIARIRLIGELQRELAIHRDAIPVVLHLLDQLYAMRRQLHAIDAAIASQPPPVRRVLRGALRAPKRKAATRKTGPSRR